MNTPNRPKAPAGAVAALLCCVALLPAGAAHAGGDHAPAHAAPAAAKAPAHEPPTRVASAAPSLPAAGAAAAGPANAADGDDPIEQLRQRLAERLSATKGSTTGGHDDLRVAPRSAGGAGAAAADKPKGGSRGAGGKAGKAGADDHALWAYNGNAGPQSWGALKPEFSLCGSGQRQSPIDIRGGLSVDLDPVRFDYQASRFAVVDNGHTVQVNLAQGNAIEVGGRRFELKQFHFHRPSEERIDGRQFEMSVHLVHKDDAGRLAVVTVLLDKGPAQPVVQKVWNNLPLERNLELPARGPIEPAELLPADRRYYTYMGSLTTPPCSEGVQWIVMRTPVTVTQEQIEIFSRIYPMNARPLQAASGRRIMQSN